MNESWLKQWMDTLEQLVSEVGPPLAYVLLGLGGLAAVASVLLLWAERRGRLSRSTVPLLLVGLMVANGVAGLLSQQWILSSIEGHVRSLSELWGSEAPVDEIRAVFTDSAQRALVLGLLGALAPLAGLGALGVLRAARGRARVWVVLGGLGSLTAGVGLYRFALAQCGWANLGRIEPRWAPEGILRQERIAEEMRELGLWLVAGAVMLVIALYAARRRGRVQVAGQAQVAPLIRA